MKRKGHRRLIQVLVKLDSNSCLLLNTSHMTSAMPYTTHVIHMSNHCQHFGSGREWVEGALPDGPSVGVGLCLRKGKLQVPVQRRSSQLYSTQAPKCPCNGCAQSCPTCWRWWPSWLDSRTRGWVPFPVRRPGKPGWIGMAMLTKLWKSV